MKIVRLSVVGALGALVFVSSASPIQAHFRSRQIFRTPAYCVNPSQSCFVEQTCGDVASFPVAEAGVCAGAGCNWSNECSGGCSQVSDVVTESVAPPLLEERVTAPLLHVPEVSSIVHAPVVHAPVMHAPFAHPPMVKAPYPAHPIYGYMAAGPYYYGVPHYYDPSWDWNRTDVRTNVPRGPVAKGRPDAYPALPYSEFAAQQAVESATVDNTRGTIVVRVPQENARVFIEGQLMRTTGLVRTFTTPPLARGRAFEMEVRGEWQGDEPHTKRVEVRAGQTTTVELGR
jgi:uncharacterized protein (TIGR03000 family)